MGIPKYAASRDENEPEIVKALEKVGCLVQRISDKGVPDLLVKHQGSLYLIEVVGDAKAKKYRKTGGLTPDQVDWHDRWGTNTAGKVRTVDDALAWVGAHKYEGIN